MLIFKAVLYCATIAAAMVFGFWEMKLKRELTDRSVGRPKEGSDTGVLDALSERMNRERRLKDIPPQMRARLSTVVILKFAFVAILIIEILLLQRTT